MYTLISLSVPLIALSLANASPANAATVSIPLLFCSHLLYIVIPHIDLWDREFLQPCTVYWHMWHCCVFWWHLPELPNRIPRQRIQLQSRTECWVFDFYVRNWFFASSSLYSNSFGFNIVTRTARVIAFLVSPTQVLHSSGASPDSKSQSLRLRVTRRLLWWVFTSGIILPLFGALFRGTMEAPSSASMGFSVVNANLQTSLVDFATILSHLSATVYPASLLYRAQMHFARYSC